VIEKTQGKLIIASPNSISYALASNFILFYIILFYKKTFNYFFK